MDMPPSGWYPDPYGVPGLLRWWDGSTWTQQTHAGSAHELSAASGPATSLDATRIGGALGPTSDEAPRTTVARAMPQPTTVQPAVPGTDLDRTRVQATVVQPVTRPPATGPSWADARPPGAYRGTEPAGGSTGGSPPWRDTAAGQADQFGTQVLPVTDMAWGTPGRGHDAGASQRRRRILLGGLLAGGTAVALALIAVVISNLNSTGSPAPAAATSAAAPATSAPSATPTAQATTPSPTQTPLATGTAGGLTDSVSGLSYALLASPWASGCPAGLSSQQTLSWSAGESAPAGQFNNNGTQTTWYGEACSASLPQQYGYTGVADLEPTAMNLVNQFDQPYYGALNHQRSQLASTPVSISGHPAWEVRYLETYPNATSLGLSFTSEEAAVVVADQGTGLAPAVFFVSVPNNLNVTNVDALVSSLTLTVTAPTQSASPQQGGGQPSGNNGNPNPGGGDGGGGNNP
jgi:hypothetical protein